MTDVVVVSTHWRALRGSANCFVPKLVDASVSGDGFTNADLHRAGQQEGIPEFSQHIVGKALKLEAVTHAKAGQFIRAYGRLRTTSPHLPAILDTEIVAALFALPALSQIMTVARMDVAALAQASRVSPDALAHAVAGKRVTGGIAHALHTALGASAPPLGQFAVSDPSPRLASRAIASTPFTLEDLKLPLPAAAPFTWP
jgi:hypothetical protein